MLLKVNPHNPAPRHVKLIVDKLREGGVIIYPTDTVYAIGCDMNNRQAIDKLCRIAGKKKKQDNLSLICSDLSNISKYTVPFENRIYKLMKKTLPGPVTYILKTNSQVPKLFKNSKKTIGIRVPDHPIPRDIVNELGNPLITSSIHNNDDIVKYMTDPEDIYEKYGKEVDLVIDGGSGDNTGSSILDCSAGDEVEIVRDTRGIAEQFLN